VELWATAEIASCRGDDLTCEPVTLPNLLVMAPIAIQF
jgi:hypothetical protein